MCHNVLMLATPDQFNQMIEIFKHGVQLTFRKGEFIIRPGEAPSGVFLIEKGLVKAFDITKYGEENMLIIRKEQEVFPLIWGITGQERSVIYQALVPTVVWRISRRNFLNYIQDPDHALAPLLDMTLEMYRIHSERIINLEYRSVRERLISFLVTMAHRFGEKTPTGTLINVPLRQTDMASSISATRETTGRELSALEKRGFIKTKSPYVIITNIEKLRTFL
jgi:CRP/FNR family cyclic AMP-dependent transcriptional regulator